MARELKQPREVNEGRFKRRLGFISGPNDCWIWASSVFKRGDKQIPFFSIMDEGTRQERKVYARRWAWESEYGPLPQGAKVINVCGEQRCVKPDSAHNVVRLANDPQVDAPGNDEEFLNER